MPERLSTSESGADVTALRRVSPKSWQSLRGRGQCAGTLCEKQSRVPLVFGVFG